MNDIIGFAKEYLDTVNAICLTIIKQKGLNTFYDLKRLRVNEPAGEFTLDEIHQLKYTFHGRGCRVESQTLNIDWDFGYDDVLCGLDPWKLAYYVRDKRNNNEWEDGNKVKKAFDDLVKKGGMEIRYNLYYFT